jgi:FAD:protein FMN transferase
MEEILFRAMGCQMMARVDNDLPRTIRYMEQVPQWFETWEQHLSRFRPDSELNRINRKIGQQEVQVSAVMEAVLRSALQAGRDSGGLVTPAVLQALENAGYDRSFDQLQSAVTGLNSAAGSNAAWERPGGAAPGNVLEMIAAPAVQVQEPALRLDVRAHRLLLAAGARLDLGGIAKGWAADQAAQRLKQVGPALVDAGGDLAISGPMSDGSPWPIEIGDPFDDENSIEMVMIRRGGVATSGRDYRRWQKDGAWKHHIIDPRSGLPAETDVFQASVIAPSTQIAEMAAKTVLILGSESGLAWLDQHADLAGLVVLEDATQLPSRRWQEYVRR